MPDGANFTALDFVTILTTTDGALLTKRFYRDESGELALQDYGNAKFYSAKQLPANKLTDLHRILIERQPNQCVVHGEIVPGINTECIRRVHRDDKYDEIEVKGEDGTVTIERVHVPPTLRECMHHWLAMDVDGLDAADDEGEFDPVADPERAVARIVKDLPEEFADRECIWQLTSGAGRKPGISMRLYWWLDRPTATSEVKAWMKPYGATAGLDTSIYTPSQPVYAAKPALADGVNDPVPERFGFAGILPTVSPPDDLVPEGIEPQERVRREADHHKAHEGFIPDTPAIVDRARQYLRGVAETKGGWGQSDPHTTTYEIAAVLGDIGCTEWKAFSLACELSPRPLPPSEVAWLRTQVANAYGGRQNEIGCGAPGSAERKYGDPGQYRDKPAQESEQASEEAALNPYRNERVNFLTIADLKKLPPPVDLVQGLLTDRENVAFVSEPKSGKTFLALEIGLCIASGKPVLDRYAVKRKGYVIYLSGEGHQGMWKRVRAWGKLRGKFTEAELEALPFIYNKGVPLAAIGKPEADTFIKEAKAFLQAKKAEIEADGGKVVLVVIDTMARSITGLPENDADTAAKYLDLTEKLRDGLDCTTLTLAHASNKETTRKTNAGKIDFRGSSGFSAGFDSVWTLERNDENNTVTLAGRWFKEFDDDDRPPLYFKLVKDALGAVLKFAEAPGKKTAANYEGIEQALEVERALGDKSPDFGKGLSHEQLAETIAGKAPSMDDEEKYRAWKSLVNKKRKALQNAATSEKQWTRGLGTSEAASKYDNKNIWRWWRAPPPY